MSAIALDPATTIDQPRRGRVKRALFGGRRKYAALLLGLLLVPGSAYAAWTITADGVGSTKFGSLTAPTVTASATPVGDLYPGTNGSLAVKVDNPNGALVVSGVAPVVGADVGQSGCPASNVTVRTLTGLSVAVPAGSNQSVTIPAAVSADPAAPQACSGASISKGVRLTFSTPGS